MTLILNVDVDNCITICIDNNINIDIHIDINIDIKIDYIITDASTVNSVHACLCNIE